MVITREEFLKKYGHVKVKFSSYYKYCFTFSGELPDGVNIYCNYGGQSDDIYRYEVNAGKEITVDQVSPDEGMVVDKGLIIERFARTY